MRRVLKSELQEAAGVSRSTFLRWVNRNLDRLLPLGYEPRAQYVCPRVVQFICREYNIDQDEL